VRSHARSRRARLLAATVAVIACLAIPATALADTTGGPPQIQPAQSRDATISIDSIAITGKVVAMVNVSFVCQPFDSYDWNTGQTYQTTDGSIEGGAVTIYQAQGRTLDWGSADFYGHAVCDGSTVNHASIPVTPQVSPWKNGTAVVGATVFISDAASFQDSDFASSGPVSVRLR
jgi:hypothetical protein